MIAYSKRIGRIKGSVIREIFKMMADPEIISLGGGSPAAEAYPLTQIREISDDLLAQHGVAMLEYGLTNGYGPFRQAYLEHLLLPKGVEADINNTIALTGSGQGIFLVADVFIDEGDTVLVESPTFLGSLNVFRKMGANLIGLEMDEQGIIIDDLLAKIKAHRPKLIYTIPTFQNPSGRSLSAERRKKIAELAAEYQVVVLEDDPYGDVRFCGDPLPPIKSFDTAGNVILLNSCSKIIAPGLRVGAAVARPEWIAKLELVKQSADTHTTTLSQAICAEFLQRGLLPAHLQKVARLYKERFQALEAGIKQYFPATCTYTRPEGGLFVWAKIPGFDMAEMNKLAVEKYKVAFVPGAPFCVNEEDGRDCLRLNYSSSSADKISAACERLGQLFA